MANKLFHIGIALVLVILLTLLTDPFMLWMPPMAAMGALLGASVLACMWAGFVMYEKSHDERERMHMLDAGRAAYLGGIAILTLALIVQGLSHRIDPWICVALGVMVVSKLAVRLYSEHYR